MNVDANRIVGSYDIAFIVLDTLRWDVAERARAGGRIPNLAAAMKGRLWERRHTPASFTYAAHHAFFSGFLPTPATPGKHPRLFASAFAGSETTVETTAVFEEATVVEGLAARGYRTICAGGVGFFNGRTPLGSVLPSLFQVAEWRPEFGVTEPRSTERQVAWLVERLDETSSKAFTFLNVSAIHQPNRHYVEGKAEDDLESHGAALEYVDSALGPLFETLGRRGTFVVACSDHGTAYGEDGWVGHRCGVREVWDVPYAHFFLES